jgi:nucleotide-binding universal stress UspA family protein
MKTLLIPVDFSVPSNNAVEYALGLSNNRDVEHIIILTNFYVSVFEQMYPSVDLVQVNEEECEYERKHLKHKLELIRAKLLKELNPGITVEVILDESTLLRSVMDVIETKKPDLMIIGSNSSKNSEESYIGTNLIELAKTSPIPVMVVPTKSHYEPVEKALVACDFSSLTHAGLLERLHKIKHWPHPKLFLLNVDPALKHLKPGYPANEIEGLVKELLEGYEYQLYYTPDKDILHGITTFATQNGMQMIIALPGKYSFLYRFTHQRITNGLAMNAYNPVLILK